MIRKNRHMIKVKINGHLVKLTNNTNRTVDDATTHLRLFDKEAGMICGKSYE